MADYTPRLLPSTIHNAPPMIGAWALNTVQQADALDLLHGLPAGSVDCCITSPPYYGLRDYGVDGQIGLEDTPQAYVKRLADLFREVKRVLKDTGTCWINLGDSYSSKVKGTGGPSEKQSTNAGSRYEPILLNTGLPDKSLMGIPWRVAFALQDDGWILRSDIIWHKPNPMPESVTDRPTKSHEYVFLFAKEPRYYYDADAIAEPVTSSGGNFSTVYASQQIGHGGVSTRKAYDKRNKRSVWTIPTKPNPEAHFATFPPDLITPMILAGCPVGGVVLDPFMGSGTTALTARQHGRNFIGCDLNPEYVAIARRRLNRPHAINFMPWLEQLDAVQEITA